MANDYVVRLQAQDNLTPNIKGATTALNNMGNSASGLDKIQEKFNRIQQSTAPLQKKLKDIKNLMAQLNINGDSNSPIYNQMAQAAGSYADAITDARNATNRFASDTMNLDAGIAAMQGIAAAGSVAAGVMGLLGTENEKVTKAILQVQSAMSILNGIQSIANILNKDSVLIQKLKQIKIAATTAMTKGDTIATTANTVATTANTAATKANTIGQNAWNIAKAIGNALLGNFTGLALVAAAGLATYALATDKSTDSLEEQSKATDNVKEAQEKFNKAVADSVGSNVAKFELLRHAWNNLKSDAEKTEWLKNNKDAFEDLGLKVDDLVSAENVFNNNTGAVVESFMARAKAAAAMDAITDAYKKYFEELNRIDNTVEGGGYYVKGKYNGPRQETSASAPSWTKGLKQGEDYTVEDYGYSKKYTMTQKGIDKKTAELNQKANDEALKRRNANRKKADEELKKQTDTLYKEIEDSQKKINELTEKGIVSNNKNKQTTPTHKNTPKNNKKEEVIDDKSIKYAEDKLKEYQDKLNKLDPNTDAFKETTKEIEKWTNIIKDRKIEALISTNFEDDKLKEFQNKLKEVHANVELDTNDADFQEQQLIKMIETRHAILKIEAEYGDSIKGLKERLKEYEGLLDVVDPNNLELINEIIDAINKTKKEIESTEIKLGIKPTIEEGSISYIEKQIKELNDKLQSKNLTVEERLEIIGDINKLQEEQYILINPQIKPGSLADIQRQIANKKAEIECEVVGSEAYMKLAQEIADLEDKEHIIQLQIDTDGIDSAIEKMEKSREKMQFITDAIGSMGNSFSSLGSAIGDTGGKMLEMAGQTMNAVSQIIPEVIKLIGVKEGEALANGTASASALPFPANLAAIASIIATITGLFASFAGSFANGGIIGGATTLGDYNIARVNAGEMILNKRQQGRLFNLLDGNGYGSNQMGGNVVFKIKGDQLYGVLKNYSNIKSKIGKNTGIK